MGEDQQVSFPIIVKQGVNQQGAQLRYYFNYSAEPVSFVYPHAAGQELLEGRAVSSGEQLTLAPWGVQIIKAG